MSDTLKTNKAASAGRMRRLVRLVREAVATTAGTMILDLVIYGEDDERVTEYLIEGLKFGDDLEATKYAIKRLYGGHEERMIDAAREDAESGKRRALESLTNDERMHHYQRGRTSITGLVL